MWNASSFPEMGLSRSISVLLLPHQGKPEMLKIPVWWVVLKRFLILSYWYSVNRDLVKTFISARSSLSNVLFRRYRWHNSLWEILRHSNNHCFFNYICVLVIFCGLSGVKISREPPAFDRCCHITDFIHLVNADCDTVKDLHIFCH